MEYPELKRAVRRQQWQAHRATVVLIEGQGIRQPNVRFRNSLPKAWPQRHHPLPTRARQDHAPLRADRHDRTGSSICHAKHRGSLSICTSSPPFPNAKYDDQADSTSQALNWIKQAPPEHAVSRYYRCQEVLSLHRQGFPIGAIAAKVPATIEEVKRWIEQGQQRQTNVLEIDARRFSETCAGCGGEIPVNTPYMKEMDLVYHEKCLRRKMFGG